MMAYISKISHHILITCEWPRCIEKKVGVILKVCPIYIITRENQNYSLHANQPNSVSHTI